MPKKLFQKGSRYWVNGWIRLETNELAKLIGNSSLIQKLVAAQSQIWSFPIYFQVQPNVPPLISLFVFWINEKGFDFFTQTFIESEVEEFYFIICKSKHWFETLLTRHIYIFTQNKSIIIPSKYKINRDKHQHLLIFHLCKDVPTF